MNRPRGEPTDAKNIYLHDSVEVFFKMADAEGQYHLFAGSNGDRADLYANDYSVKMMQSSRFAGNSSGMIILNGAIGDAGVRKYFADGFSGEFVFRIGISEHYTPAVYNFTSAVTSSDGYINVKPMNKLHSNIETTPVNYLEYYWMVETEGLSGYTVTHEYFYTDDLMVIADPSYDLLAQRFDGTWENMTTGSVLTDENKILITGLTCWQENTLPAHLFTRNFQPIIALARATGRIPRRGNMKSPQAVGTMLNTHLMAILL